MVRVFHVCFLSNGMLSPDSSSPIILQGMKLHKRYNSFLQNEIKIKMIEGTIRDKTFVF